MKKSRTKSALALIRGDQTTYVERSDSAKRESVRLLMTAGITNFDSGVEEIAEGAKSFIRGCNKIREAGRKFEEAEKIGQREFRAWHTDMESWKQDAIRRAKVKAAQKVYRNLPAKAEKMEDCAQVIQEVLELCGLIERTRRDGQIAHEPPNALTAFLSTTATVETWLRKMEAPSGAAALEAGPSASAGATFYAGLKPETLEQIEQATRPIAERHEIVKRLLKQRDGQ